ncbi:hypothetical protein ACFX13_001646 [Malus domestica]
MLVPEATRNSKRSVSLVGNNPISLCSISSSEHAYEIERELTGLFPTRLTDLIEFLVASGTSMKDGRGKGRERVGDEILVLGRRLHEAEGVVREGSAAVRSENEQILN